MEIYKRQFFSESSILMKHIVFRNTKDQKLRLNLGLEKTNYVYFNFTMDVYERGRDVGGGAAHDTMIKILPELKKHIDLHLSDINGVPLHAVENGFYYLKNPNKYNVQVVADHFRISTSEASKLQKGVKKEELTKNDIILFVEQQKIRWKKEADNAIKWIRKLNDVEEHTTNIIY